MTNAVVQKASLWRETLTAIKASMSTMWPLLLVFGVLLGFSYFMMSPSPAEMQIQRAALLHQAEMQRQMANDPSLSPAERNEHTIVAPMPLDGAMTASLKHEGFRQLLWYGLFVVVLTVGYYIFTVKYLQFAMKRNRPELSVNGFFYWFGKIFLKWLRGFWLLLPVIGWFFFYPRAVLRYQLVSPLAVLRRSDELKTSWRLTENNWWRIFGNLLLLILLLEWLPLLALVLICLPVGIGYGIVVGMTHQFPEGINAGFLVILSLLQGILGSWSIAISTIFSCTCYRILSQEAQQASANTSTLTPSASA